MEEVIINVLAAITLAENEAYDDGGFEEDYPQGWLDALAYVKKLIVDSVLKLAKGE